MSYTDQQIDQFETFTIYQSLFNTRLGIPIHLTGYGVDGVLLDQTKWQVKLWVKDRKTKAIVSTDDNGVPLALNGVYMRRDLTDSDCYYAIHGGLPPGQYEYHIWAVLEDALGNRLDQLPYTDTFQVHKVNDQPPVPA